MPTEMTVEEKAVMDAPDEEEVYDEAGTEQKAEAGTEQKAEAGTEQKADETAEKPPQIPPMFRDTGKDISAALSHADALIAELGKKYENGDIDQDEYYRQHTAVISQKTKLESVLLNRRDAEDRQWEAEVSGFLRSNPQFAPRVPDPKGGGPAVNAVSEAFTGVVNALIGNDRVPPSLAIEGMTGTQILEYAKSIVERDFESVFGKLPEPSKPLTKQQAVRAAAGVGQRAAVPPSLSGVPSAAPEVSRYAELDRTLIEHPADMEALFKTMSESERRAYLRS